RLRGTIMADDYDDDDVKKPTTSGKAIASVILGLLAFCLPVLIPSIIALVLGIMGVSEVSNSRGRLKGSGLATTGIVLSVLSLVFGLIAVPLALLLPAVQKVREAANRTKSMNNIKQITIGVHNSAMMNRDRIPDAQINSQDNQPLLSWRVSLLPYIDED